MPASALALVLTAALLHALWNLVAKRAGGDQRFVLLTALMVAVLWAPVGLWVAWDELPRWGLLAWAAVLASGLTHLAYFTVLLRGYRASDLTVVYPVARGTGPLLSALGAVLLLGESLSAVGAAGVLAVTVGIVLIAGGPRLLQALRGRDGDGDTASQRVRAGLGWGAATGATIAAYTLIDGAAVKLLAVSPILVDYFGNLLRIPFMLPLLRDRAALRSAWRAQWRHALAVAVLSPAAYVMVLYAMQLAPLSHVAPAREVSMLFAALLGGRLLGEGELGWRLVGAAFIALGVAGLALG
ncbi:EamA family transporter [Methylibium petroleiphilum]|uniref:Putative membrane protein n=1 Tax=Methylibium petroleiphilum (strain ATCC BAA-1232 / LMG 22953 / PM1) TaxID=420662 RepID=A2SEP9_METPP|nr:membrane protein [Methylibium petroleiphilum]ABM94038.1 putative membrane protein [Methylibium petroleiphilum PM1]